MLTLDDVIQGENLREVYLYADGTTKVQKKEHPPKNPEDVLELSYSRREVFANLNELSLRINNSITYAYCHVDDVPNCIAWLKAKASQCVDKEIELAKERIKKLRKIKKDLSK
jgi:hypothetical protein